MSTNKDQSSINPSSIITILSLFYTQNEISIFHKKNNIFSSKQIENQVDDQRQLDEKRTFLILNLMIHINKSIKDSSNEDLLSRKRKKSIFNEKFQKIEECIRRIKSQKLFSYKELVYKVYKDLIVYVDDKLKEDFEKKLFFLKDNKFYKEFEMCHDENEVIVLYISSFKEGLFDDNLSMNEFYMYVKLKKRQ